MFVTSLQFVRRHDEPHLRHSSHCLAPQRGLVVIISSSLASIYAAEARLRTGKAQNTDFDRRHSCRSTVSGAAQAEMRNR